MTDKIHKLSDELGAVYSDTDDSVTLYDITGESPVCREHLSSEEMVKLISLYVDGSCPICFNEIPQHDVVCDDCYRDATAVERI